MLKRKQNGHILIIQRQAKLLLLIQKVIKWHTTYIHPFNDPLSRITRVSRYQKDQTDLDFTEARDSEWQWHQLGHMQVSTPLQTDNHASTPPLSFLQARCPSCRPTNSIKALKANGTLNNEIYLTRLLSSAAAAGTDSLTDEQDFTP